MAAEAQQQQALLKCIWQL